MPTRADERERAYEVSACGGHEQPHRSGVAALPYQPPWCAWWWEISALSNRYTDLHAHASPPHQSGRVRTPSVKGALIEADTTLAFILGSAPWLYTVTGIRRRRLQARRIEKGLARLHL